VHHCVKTASAFLISLA